MPGIWYRQTYEATAADAAAAITVRLYTPDGVLHDPAVSGQISKREDWLVHHLQCYVLKTTSGMMKPGLVGQLIIGLDWPGSWMPLITPAHGCMMMNHGLIYHGPPFRATHGVGWAMYRGALADTDKVVLRVFYQVLERGPI